MVKGYRSSPGPVKTSELGRLGGAGIGNHVTDVRHPGDELHRAFEAQSEARVGDARREIHRHIGDFALFWAGLYPEALRRRQAGTVDQFVDYCTQGKRAYHIASTLPVDAAHEDQQAVLERLSRQFELCVYGLGEIRREWEQRDDTPGGPVLLE